ncbi:MAG: hypothetical protein ACK5SX_00970 [Sandaracinobacter sp.]
MESDPKLDALLAEIAAVEAKIERAKALSGRLKRAAVDHSRRADTRRKIILGAALLAAARDNPELTALIEALLATVKRPADRKLFNGLSTSDLIATAMDETHSHPKRRARRTGHKPD